MPAKLKELQEKLYAKQDVLKSIFDEAKLENGDYDFLRAAPFKTLSSQQACVEKLQEMEAEAEAIHTEVKFLESMEELEEKNRERIKEREIIDDPMVHPVLGRDGLPMRFTNKSLGTLVAEAWPKDDRHPTRNGIWLEKDFQNFDVKTLMQTSAGFAPETTRIPRIAEFAHRPIQVTDLFPIGNTAQAAIVYMEETTSTNTAAETAEAASIPEASLAFTERTVNVKKIPVYIAVTDEQLADVAQVQGIIDSRLRFFVQQRLDLQIVVGDGTGSNMTGLLNTGSIQTQAKGADPIPDAIYKGMVKIRVTGRAAPSGVVINPTDWQGVRLLRTADGLYIWGNPSEAGPMRIWGIPVAEADVITQGTALVGDFTNHTQLWMRQGVEIVAGFINDDFIKGRQAIKATLRGVIVVYRPAAICTVTGL